MPLSFTIGGTYFHSDNFYQTTLPICSQETAFWCFMGELLSVLVPLHDLCK